MKYKPRPEILQVMEKITRKRQDCSSEEMNQARENARLRDASLSVACANNV